jgi:hypothetical protein
MRWVLVSLIVHAAVIAALSGGQERLVEWRPPQLPACERVETTTIVELVEEPAVRGGGGKGGQGSPSGRRAATPVGRRVATPVRQPDRDHDAWERISVRTEQTAQGDQGQGHGGSSSRGGNRSGDGNAIGNGSGGGNGGGNGNGIGFGTGGGIRVANDVPPPPPPPLISKARPAKLVWPTRDEDVDDDEAFFIARVTVDEEGTVVGANMVKTRPGARADRAADLIWQFRYAPALDDRGAAIRSTFEQPFQVR